MGSMGNNPHYVSLYRDKNIHRKYHHRMNRPCSICLWAIGVTFAGFILLTIAVAIYRPLPAQLTETKKDRIIGQILEPLTRIIYYYPSRLCPTANCMLYWTRWSMSRLNRLMAPWFYHDSHLLMETTHWNGVKVRVYHPRNQTAAESDGAIIYLHGGGFGMGSIEMFESLTRTLAGQISTRLFVSVDYRLAPETVFPGGLEDCERVLDYVVERGPAEYGIDPRKIVVMGDSAGGNLATVIAQRRKRSSVEPKLLGQALLYPLLQFSDMQTFSYRFTGKTLDGLAFVDPLSIAFYYLWYAGVDANAHPEYAEAARRNGHVSKEAKAMREKYLDYSLLPESFRNNLTDNTLREPIKELADFMTPFLTNPDFAPLMQPDLSDLPSTLVLTCEFDVLRDEGVIYARRLKEAGVPTQWTHYEHGFHGMLNLHNRLEIARGAIAVIKEWTIKLLRNAEL